ncbi:uncharacterized protein [Procambarus clarkii]|uniref:uncharacterized protein n=1 Tax=Procambarus clarkii TaxID=6728 RepID=UPI001E677A7C|nr:uncharacterized protein LOC123758710 [Procambarus clarkii]
MACSIRTVVGCGIFLAIVDIIHGLCTVGFYGYRFISFYFYLCPRELDIAYCQNKIYIYEQLFTFRTYIGLGEGGVTPLFDIIYIIALVKHKPWLTWFWLIKAFGSMGINVFYISSWMVRRISFQHITYQPEYFEQQFLVAGITLSIAQLIITVIFCIIAGIFTYKVAEERTRSRRSLHKSPKLKKHGRATAPPLSNYGDDDDDDATSTMRAGTDRHFTNHGLADSTSKLPLPGSNTSLDKKSWAEVSPHTAV